MSPACRQWLFALCVASWGCCASRGLAQEATETPPQEAAAFAQPPSTDADQPAAADEHDRVQFVSLAPKLNEWLPTPPQLVVGDIQQFEADKLVIRELDGTQRSIDSRQIMHIEPVWRSPEAAKSHQLFADKRYQEVVSTVPEAYKTVPKWQQRLLISELVQSAEALGSPRTAGILWLNLAASKPPAMLYADMPLCWTVREADQALLEKAEEWLASEDEAAQLLGASWLLFGGQRSQAEAVLQRLQASQNPTLAQLAVVQSWRLVPPPQTQSNLQQWFAFRDQLLEPLQLGPSELLADRLMRGGQSELAIGQWLRIATIHEDRYYRAAQALESAAAQLQRLGREAESRRLEPWIEELRGQ